jgi:hypothetical protein
VTSRYVSPLSPPNPACPFEGTGLSRDWLFAPGVTTGGVIPVAFAAPYLPLRGSGSAPDSGGTQQLLTPENANPLASFPP